MTITRMPICCISVSDISHNGQTSYHILKCDASVRLCALRSEQALTLYTQRQTALLWPIYPVSAVVGS